MSGPSAEQITGMLVRWSQGDEHALDDLMPLVYPHLRRLASYLLKGQRPGHTLQPTALINEAYIKLEGAAKIPWQNRAHFIAVAARAMRQVLIDYARRRNCAIRGEGMPSIPLDEALVFAEERSAELITLDSAITRFAREYPRHAKVVELRFYGGLTNQEIADVLQIAPNTVMRDWNLAKAWLRKEMENKKDGGDTSREG